MNQTPDTDTDLLARIGLGQIRADEAARRRRAFRRAFPFITPASVAVAGNRAVVGMTVHGAGVEDTVFPPATGLPAGAVVAFALDTGALVGEVRG